MYGILTLGGATQYRINFAVSFPGFGSLVTISPSLVEENDTHASLHVTTCLWSSLRAL